MHRNGALVRTCTLLCHPFVTCLNSNPACAQIGGCNPRAEQCLCSCRPTLRLSVFSVKLAEQMLTDCDQHLMQRGMLKGCCKQGLQTATKMAHQLHEVYAKDVPWQVLLQQQ